MNTEKIKKDWSKRGFSFGVWIDPPGQIWEDFSHSTDELFLLLEGEVELIISGKQIKPKIGEELLIPARALHTVKNVGNTTSRWCYGYK